MEKGNTEVTHQLLQHHPHYSGFSLSFSFYIELTYPDRNADVSENEGSSLIEVRSPLSYVKIQQQPLRGHALVAYVITIILICQSDELVYYLGK